MEDWHEKNFIWIVLSRNLSLILANEGNWFVIFCVTLLNPREVWVLLFLPVLWRSELQFQSNWHQLRYTGRSNEKVQFEDRLCGSHRSENTFLQNFKNPIKVVWYTYNKSIVRLIKLVPLFPYTMTFIKDLYKCICTKYPKNVNKKHIFIDFLPFFRKRKLNFVIRIEITTGN